MASKSPKRGKVATIIGKRLSNLKDINDRMTRKTGMPENAPGISTDVRKKQPNLGPEVKMWKGLPPK